VGNGLEWMWLRVVRPAYVRLQRIGRRGLTVGDFTMDVSHLRLHTSHAVAPTGLCIAVASARRLELVGAQKPADHVAVQ
jgi:hypothetical protein